MQHDDSPVTRSDFINIASPLRALFYTLMTVIFVAVGWLFAVRVQNWERGKPDNRRTSLKNAERRA